MLQNNDYAELILSDGEYRRAVIYTAMRGNPIYRAYFTIPELVSRLFGTSSTIGKGTYATLCTRVRHDLMSMINAGTLERTDDARYRFIEGTA